MALVRKAVVVVDATTAGRSMSGKKRPREEDDRGPSAEKQAFLSGSVAGVMAATSGRIKDSRSFDKPRTDEMDFRKALQSVRDLGAQNMTKARNRKELESKKLAALGARVTWKPQTMPFKMYIGVKRARDARDAKAAEEARVGGLVTGVNHKKRRLEKQGMPRWSREDSDDPTPDNIRGPVMHIGRQR